MHPLPAHVTRHFLWLPRRIYVDNGARCPVLRWCWLRVAYRASYVGFTSWSEWPA